MNLSFLVFVLLLWINSNVFEYVCKLYLFTPMNFLIHNWYRLLLCTHNYLHVQDHLHILFVNGLHFCVWNHVLPIGHMLYIFICKNSRTIIYVVTDNIKKNWLSYRNIKICQSFPSLRNTGYHWMILVKCSSASPRF